MNIVKRGDNDFSVYVGDRWCTRLTKDETLWTITTWLVTGADGLPPWMRSSASLQRPWEMRACEASDAHRFAPQEGIDNKAMLFCQNCGEWEGHVGPLRLEARA